MSFALASSKVIRWNPRTFPHHIIVSHSDFQPILSQTTKKEAFDKPRTILIIWRNSHSGMIETLEIWTDSRLR